MAVDMKEAITQTRSMAVELILILMGPSTVENGSKAYNMVLEQLLIPTVHSKGKVYGLKANLNNGFKISPYLELLLI